MGDHLSWFYLDYVKNADREFLLSMSVSLLFFYWLFIQICCITLGKVFKLSKILVSLPIHQSKFYLAVYLSLSLKLYKMSILVIYCSKLCLISNCYMFLFLRINVLLQNFKIIESIDLCRWFFQKPCEREYNFIACWNFV